MKHDPKLRQPLLLLAVGVLCSFALPALAQRAIIVDAAGGGDFTEIQPAVDAAPVGGLIRVRHGVYPEDVIIRQGIRLIGDRWIRPSVECVHIEGSVSVFDLPANQSFVGADLVLSSVSDESRTFNFENCQGNIHLANSAGRLELRHCNYVTTDLFFGVANNVEAGAVVEDSFLVGTNFEWRSLLGRMTPMEVTRSKVILVGGRLINLNFGLLDPPLPAIVLTDSELIYAGDVSFLVACDPAIQTCPPEMKLIGSSTAENISIEGGGKVLFADIHEPDLLQLRYGTGDSSVFAVVASFLNRRFELAEGTLYVDPAASILIHLCPPSPPPFPTIRINLSPPSGNRFGIPITFQAAALKLSGEVILSTPLTVVL